MRWDDRDMHAHAVMLVSLASRHLQQVDNILRRSENSVLKRSSSFLRPWTFPITSCALPGLHPSSQMKLPSSETSSPTRLSGAIEGLPSHR